MPTLQLHSSQPMKAVPCICLASRSCHPYLTSDQPLRLVVHCSAVAVHCVPMAVSLLLVLLCVPTVSVAQPAAPGGTPTSSPVSTPVQLAERKALLALKSALNNHPAFTDLPPGLNPWGTLNTSARADSGAGLAPGAVSAPLSAKEAAPSDVNPQLYLPCANGAQWAWLQCSPSRRVISINMGSGVLYGVNSSWGGAPGVLPLTGSVPWRQMSALQRLTELVLAGNSVSGSLQGVGALASLSVLWLSNNNFSGPIPGAPASLTAGTPPSATLGTSTKGAEAPSPAASGEAAVPLASASSQGLPLALSSLMLDANAMTGPIPPSLSLLTCLTRLNVAVNPGLGAWAPFPGSLGALTGLTELDLHGTSLRGTLPEQWGALGRLTLLNLGSTLVLSAPGGEGIPRSWSSLRALQQLTLSSCNLSASYPTSLTSLPSIQGIDLSHNFLYGPLPSNVWAPPQLASLDISGNFLNGTVLLPDAARTGSPDFRFSPASNCFTGVVQAPSGSFGTAPNFTLATQRSAAACESFYQAAWPAPPPPPPDGGTQGTPSPSPVGLIVGVAAGAVALLLLLLSGLGFFCWRRAEGAGRGSDEEKLWAHPRNVGGENSNRAAVDSVNIRESSGECEGEGPSEGGLAVGVYGASSVDEEGVVIERQGAKEYSFADLQKATNNFGAYNLLGSGQYGEVFYGELPQEDVVGRVSQVLKVAVKRQAQGLGSGAGASRSRPRDVASFRNEIRILSAAYHRNLVALRGYCWEQGQLLLVYDFVSFGSLDRLLHHSAQSSPRTECSGRDFYGARAQGPGTVLTWQQRVQLAVGAARGINFLHNGAVQPILHLDIKCGNILVDENFTAKVADFGLSRVYLDPEEDAGAPGNAQGGGAQAGRAGGSSSLQSASGVRGTPGYVDPGCQRTSELSERSDVYSFGVVLLELATGWKPIDRVSGETQHVVARVVEAVNRQGMEYLWREVFGSSIAGAGKQEGSLATEGGSVDASCRAHLPTLEQYTRLVCLALWCCLDSSTRRPKMRQIFKVLVEIEEGNPGAREEEAAMLAGRFVREEFKSAFETFRG